MFLNIFFTLVTDCSQPQISILPIYTQSNPQVILRSKLFSLNTATYFSCNSSYTLTFRWKLTFINSTSNVTIDLSSNPTWQSTMLVIQAYTLGFGLYAFNFQTNVTVTTSGGMFFTNNLTTYVQIVPTGLALYGIQDGVSGLQIGSQQSFSLNPALYSLDLDNLIQPNSLKYKFYCFTMKSNGLGNTIVNTTQSVDLFTYKNNSLLQMNRNSTCFTSNSK